MERAEKDNWYQRNVFHAIGLHVLYDLFGSTSTMQLNPSGNRVQRKIVGGGFIGVGYRPRINLVNFDDRNSISVNFPFTLGIGQTDIYHDSLNIRAETFGYFDVPILVHYNFGYHSTYNNIDHWGLSFGAGVVFKKTPLFHSDYFTNSFGRSIGLVQDVISVSYKSDHFNPDAEGVTVSFGFLSGWSFRIAFLYLLRY